MSLRMPKDFQGGLMQNSGTSVLHAELVAEQAASLGIAGRKVAEAMAALQDMSSVTPGVTVPKLVRIWPEIFLQNQRRVVPLIFILYR